MPFAFNIEIYYDICAQPSIFSNYLNFLPGSLENERKEVFVNRMSPSFFFTVLVVVVLRDIPQQTKPRKIANLQYLPTETFRHTDEQWWFYFTI